MKKRKLASLGIDAKELLTREELKNINGGTGSQNGPCTCNVAADCEYSGCINPNNWYWCEQAQCRQHG